MKTANIFIAILIFASSALHAQENVSKPNDETSNVKLKMLGLGFRTSPFNIEDLYQNYIPITNNKIIVTINPLKNFRIQPEFGYYRSKEFSTLINDDLIGRTFSVGAGFYGMWQKGNVNFYIGPKFTNVSGEFDSVDSDYNPNPPYNTIYRKTTNSSSSFNYGLISGGEYFFGNHFSVGAEIGLMHSKVEVKYSNTPAQNFSSSKIMTETNLLFRFYF